MLREPDATLRSRQRKRSFRSTATTRCLSRPQGLLRSRTRGDCRLCLW
nr:hypothetical protein JVH1_7750 [Rhodococcus sp. JVH1]